MVFNRAITLLLLAHFSSSYAFTSDSLKVKIGHRGVLVGRHYVTINGRHMRAFMGIPYAQPPVEGLRFKPPVAFPEWQGERMAIQDSPICLHICPYIRATQLEGQEDCLYLNVYTPPLEVLEKSQPLPVMVWFHGGGWQSGTGGDHYYGPQHLLDRNIILVSGNYRLGPLGFLSTETTDCPGNFGLKDQVEVLRWVQKYIASFGGNPKSVTIFGESAGAASITYHMNSKKSEGLFHRAILQSGTFFNPWAQPAHRGVPSQRAAKLARFFKCDIPIIKTMIDCLRKVPANDLMSKFNVFFEWENHPMIPFPPVIEPDHPDAFLIEHPRETPLKSLDIPITAGITSGEGLLSSAPLLSNEERLEALKRDKDRLFPLIFNYDHWDLGKQERVTRKIEEYYFKNGHDYDRTNHRNFTDLHSDAFANYGFDEYLEKRLSQDSATTYVYVYDHKAEASMTEAIQGGDQYYGVCHADELQMLFPLGKALFPTTIPSKRDVLMRNALLDMWVNFATFGNPTPPGGKLTKWEPTTKYPWNYARIGTQDADNWYILQNERQYVPERLRFWKTLQPYEFLRSNLGKEEL